MNVIAEFPKENAGAPPPGTTSVKDLLQRMRDARDKMSAKNSHKALLDEAAVALVELSMRCSRLQVSQSPAGLIVPPSAQDIARLGA